MSPGLDEDHRYHCQHEQSRHQPLRIAGKIQFEHGVLPPFLELDGGRRQKFVTKVQRGLSLDVVGAAAAT